MKEIKSILKKIVVGVMSVVIMSGVITTTVFADEMEIDILSSQIIFTPVSSIKIGEELWGKFQYHNAPMGVLPAIGFSENDGEKFLLVGSGGWFPENLSDGPVKGVFQQSSVGTTFCDAAINIGTIQAKCYEDYEACYNQEDPIAAYPVTIEEPVITTNAKETYYVNDILDLETALTNTALTQGNIEEKKEDPYAIQEMFTYQAKVEILEGSEGVVVSEQDYSQALGSIEKLEFQQAGTIKLKISYEPIWLLDSPIEMVSEGEQTLADFYKAEKIITINVVDAKELLSEKITEIELLDLQEEDYTVDSWNAFSLALNNANIILTDEDATNEEYVQVYEALISAKDGLKKKQDGDDFNSGQGTHNPTNPSGSNQDTNNSNKSVLTTSAQSTAPKTGDVINVPLMLIILAGSLLAIVTLMRRICVQ
ncbi:hypothetical protein LJC18_01670 [Lachnospiraceae bacterium OttesenSCG-928-E19]|nr:hypothetical protein [Lachnospiraceae bacterium OttesenSCG-928-E19]